MMEIFRRKKTTQSEQPRRKRIIVEVGCGSYPFFSPDSGKRTLTEQEVYIGIDRFEDNQLRERAEKILQVQIPGAYSLLQADARQLPLADHTADEVIYCNVFGDYRVADIKQQVMTEAARVIRRHGVVTIVETYSPEDTPLNELSTIARRANLRQTNRGNEHNTVAIDQYNPHDFHSTRYIATFTPRRIYFNLW